MVYIHIYVYVLKAKYLMVDHGGCIIVLEKQPVVKNKNLFSHKNGHLTVV